MIRWMNLPAALLRGEFRMGSLKPPDLTIDAAAERRCRYDSEATQ